VFRPLFKFSEEEKGMQYFPYAGEPRLPPACMQLRARKETATRDTVNARQFEHWQTDTPIPQAEARPLRPPRPVVPLGPTDYDISGQAQLFRRDYSKDALYDMNPINSRLDPRDFKQARSFDEMGPSLALNPYFDRYDPTRDPRNAIRELRSVVNEDRYGEKGVLESRRMLDREFNSRWVPQGYAEKEKMDSLLAYEIIKPQQDDYRRNYKGEAPPSQK
jgi:hypothetical protein